MSAFPLRHWAKRGPLACLLFPAALLLGAVSRLRRALYRSGLPARQRLPVPVVVVGNIHVGGVGKTPLTLYLLRALREAGFTPGVISRGYGRKGRGISAVHASSSAAEVGDEPLFLHRASACPVFVGSDRAEAGRSLLCAHPDVDILLSDDGLQHYRLARDVELCVLDGFRGWGNGWLLPAGPLREGRERLNSVDALIVHGEEAPLPGLPDDKPRFRMRLQAGEIHRLGLPDTPVGLDALRGRRLLAVSAIGDPARFHRTLEQLGLSFETRSFPDHHAYEAGDLDTSADLILMTEKDAVKCRGLDDGKIHVLPVTAIVEPDLGRWLLNRLRPKNGRQTA